MSDDAQNRRRFARVPAELSVEVRHEGNFSFLSSSDISTGGCFFANSIPQPVGSRVRVSFEIPGDPNPIACEGEVVNVPDRTRFGMGIRFLDLPEEDRLRIERFTEALQEGS